MIEVESRANELRKALRRAFSLGQTYWRQADSESYRQNKMADATEAEFEALVAKTVLTCLESPTEVPEGMVLVNRSMFVDLFLMVDPPPVEVDGKTMTYRNPNAAEVLTRISALVLAMLGDSKIKAPQ